MAAPFAVGAVAGAALWAGIGGAGSSTPAVAGSVSAPSAADVASTSTKYDAATIYKKDSPGVVDIVVTEAASSQSGGGLSPFSPRNGSQQAQAEGTGFVYDKQGDIVTASHVVSGASKITVRFADGTRASATLVGSDPSSDTAVIKVDTPASKLMPLALADSSTVEPGEGVVAIGSPFGYTESISAGIVSAVDRDIDAPNGYAIPNAIQTDAAINHGNSGGPLIDASGKVVGINVQIATDDQSSSSDNAGVGFAVPSNSVRAVVEALIAGRAVAHPYLGISIGDNPSGSGARVGTVRSGSPAASAGLIVGDVIVSVDGQAIENADQLTAVVAQHHSGDTLRLKVERKGSALHISATLGTRPASSST
jgi:putative serine protease PepD